MTHHWLGQGQISLSLLDLYLLLHPGMPPLFYDSFMIFYDLRIFMISDNFTNSRLGPFPIYILCIL